MPPLTAAVLEQIDAAATRTSVEELFSYLRAALGERVAAYLGGDADRAAMPGSDDVRDVRLRVGYRVVRMIQTPYDSETAKAWLFGTNARLGDRAPIEILARAITTEQLADVRRAAQQFATAA